MQSYYFSVILPNKTQRKTVAPPLCSESTTILIIFRYPTKILMKIFN